MSRHHVDFKGNSIQRNLLNSVTVLLVCTKNRFFHLLPLLKMSADNIIAHLAQTLFSSEDLMEE